jgi:hypothetical protein
MFPSARGGAQNVENLTTPVLTFDKRNLPQGVVLPAVLLV